MMNLENVFKTISTIVYTPPHATYLSQKK